jgi:hypothetical protein
MAAPSPPIDESRLAVRVEALAPSYRPLDPAVARITNQSPVTVYENLCGGLLEGYGYVPGEWNGSYGTARVCYESSDRIPGPNFRPISPGSSVDITLPINDSAYAGQWRFNVDLRDAEGDVLPLAQRASEPFEVIR